MSPKVFRTWTTTQSSRPAASRQKKKLAGLKTWPKKRAAVTSVALAGAGRPAAASTRASFSAIGSLPGSR